MQKYAHNLEGICLLAYDKWQMNTKVLESEPSAGLRGRSKAYATIVKHITDRSPDWLRDRTHLEQFLGLRR
jgi:hypothetical protein